MIEFSEPNIGWLDHLPATPKRVISDLLSKGTSYDEAIDLWLAGAHQANIVGMGGSGEVKTYSKLFMSEFRLLICTDEPKYRHLRSQVPKIDKGTVATATGIVSTAFAPSLGFATAIIAPAIVLGFLAIAKVGITAWCSQRQ